MRAVLTLPTGSLVAEQSHEQPVAAVDLLVDVLSRELERHRGRLRRSYLERRRARLRDGLHAAAALLSADVERGDRAGFGALLAPLLDSLRAHARRELRVLELQGHISERTLSAADALDDVVTLAWERLTSRPHPHLDLWMLELLHERLARLADATDRGEPASGGNRWPEEAESQDQVRGFDQAPLLIELLTPPGEPPEPIVETPEVRSRIVEQLVRMPPARRQALLLEAFEGLSASDLGLAQSRSDEAVRTDLDAGRHDLRTALR